MKKSNTPLIKHISGFLDYCDVVKGLSSTSIENYHRFLSRFVYWLTRTELTEIKPHELTNDHIYRYRLFLSRSISKKDGRELKKNSFKDQIDTLNQFALQSAAGGRNTLVIVDEVQKIPALLDLVQKAMDQRSHRFILSGSSARKLKRSEANLLAGRALKYNLNPFMAAELGSKFSFPAALKYGMLPLLFQEENPQEILEAYVSLYLQEEVYREGLVRNIDSFARFLEAISFSHGSLLNVSNIARECEVKRKAVENYIPKISG